MVMAQLLFCGSEQNEKKQENEETFSVFYRLCNVERVREYRYLLAFPLSLDLCSWRGIGLSAMKILTDRSASGSVGQGQYVLIDEALGAWPLHGDKM